MTAQGADTANLILIFCFIRFFLYVWCYAVPKN